MDSNDQLSSHPALQEQEPWESIFLFSIYLQSTMNLDLPNDDRLEQSSMSSSAQLHIPYRENKKRAKAKSTFFTFARFLFSDRKSTRLNSSHQIISYAVFCLKKKKKKIMKE